MAVESARLELFDPHSTRAEVWSVSAKLAALMWMMRARAEAGSATPATDELHNWLSMTPTLEQTAEWIATATDTAVGAPPGAQAHTRSSVSSSGAVSMEGTLWQWRMDYHDRCGGVSTHWTDEIALTTRRKVSWHGLSSRALPPCCLPGSCADEDGRSAASRPSASHHSCDRCASGAVDLCERRRDGTFRRHGEAPNVWLITLQWFFAAALAMLCLIYCADRPRSAAELPAKPEGFSGPYARLEEASDPREADAPKPETEGAGLAAMVDGKLMWRSKVDYARGWLSKLSPWSRGRPTVNPRRLPSPQRLPPPPTSPSPISARPHTTKTTLLNKAPSQEDAPVPSTGGGPPKPRVVVGVHNDAQLNA